MPAPSSRPAWFSLSSGTPAALNAVDFVSDGRRGLAVGNGGVAFRTTDGGASWTFSFTGTTADLLSVSVPATGSGQVAYACGAGGTILRTDNFGTSWAAQPAPFTTLHAILFPGGDTFGYCVGDGSTVLQTSTGGLVWNAQSPPAADYHAVSAPFTGQTAFIGGTGGRVAITESGGALWTARPIGVSATVRALATPTGATVYAGASDGNVYRSFLGGSFWETTTPPGLSRSLAWTNSTSAWSAGDGIARTEDGGTTWGISYLPSSPALRGIWMSAAGVGYAVGDAGTILKTVTGGK